MNATAGTPAVSILLPVRGRRTTTRSAVQSLLEQDFEDFELLVVGQQDVERATAALPQDPRIRRIARLEPGIVSALNTGLAARGTFIARMDDDDIAYPNRLSTQLELLRRLPTPAMVGAKVRMVDANGSTEGIADGNHRYAEWLNGLIRAEAIAAAVFIENPLPHPTWLAPRTVFERLEGYRHGPFAEDHDFILRAARAGVTFAKPDETLLDWRDHDDRLTRTDERYAREAFIEMKAAALTHPQAGFALCGSNRRGVWIAGVGRSARRWCDALTARDVEVHGFVDLAGPRKKNSKRHRPVLDYDGLLAQRGDDLLVGAVTRPEAREHLANWCRSVGWVAMRDYVLGD